jgi:kynureninase
VAQTLLARDILVDYRPDAGIRIAPHFYTRDDEVELAVAAMDEILEREEWKKFAGEKAVVT